MSRLAGVISRGSRSITVWVVVLATVVKIWFAVTTFGTNDVWYWQQFSWGVSQEGPIGIYGHPFTEPYNHMPATGWLLLTLNQLVGPIDLPASPGIATGIGLLLRLLASAADVVTAFLLWEIVRRYRSDRQAAFVAAAVAASPVVIVISGFHGNTDSVCVMLALLALYLLHVRDQPLPAGLAIGLAVSLKLTPIVALPWLVYVAVRRGRAALLRFLGGGALVFVVFWGPVLALRFEEFRDSALDYRGVGLREWGFAYFVSAQGPSWASVGQWLQSTGSLLAVGLAMLAPFVVLALQRREANLLALAGLPLATFLLLSPAYGMQYLTWALAAVYLLDLRLATLYNVAASIFVLVVYDSWNHAPPWRWDVALAAPFNLPQVLLMALTWSMLLVSIVIGPAGGAVAHRSSARPEHEVTNP